MDVGVFTTGVVEPVKKVSLRTKVGGMLIGVHSDVGNSVKKGEVLVRIESEEYIQTLVEIERLKIELAKFAIEIENGVKKLESLKVLCEEGVVAKETLEKVEVEYKKEILSLETLKNQLDLQMRKREELDMYIRIISPIDGVILEKYVEERMVISPGMVLFVVGALNNLAVRCNIPEVDIEKVSMHAQAKITIEGVRDTFNGKIFCITPFIKTTGGSIPSFETLVQIENPSSRLYIGRTVNVEILSPEIEERLVIPIEAVFLKENKKSVFVVENGYLKLQEITTGMVDSIGEYIEIIKGLKEGQWICTSIDEEKVKEGMKVNISEEGNSSDPP